MKSVVTSLIFILAVLTGPPSVAAELLDPPTTDHSAFSFCGDKAKNAMNDLNDLTKSKLDEIKNIKSEINNLNSKKIMISGYLKMRDEFLDSYKTIANQKQINDKNLSNNLDTFKQLLNTSLTMSVVNLVAQSDKSTSAPKSIEELCKNPKNNNRNICEYVNKNPNTHETQALKQTLSNVNLALENSSNPEKIKADLDLIYNTIPSPISPDKILSDLANFSPYLMKALAKTEDKGTVMECLTNISKKESCLEILEDPDKRNDIKENVTREMNSVHKEFSNNKFELFFASLDISNAKSKDKKLEKKVNDASDFLDNQLAENNDKQKKPEFTKEAINDFKKACKQIEGRAFNMKECDENAKKIVAIFEKESTRNDERLQDAIGRLNKALDATGSIGTLDKLKQYVAQKYIRSCGSNTKSDDIISSNTCPYIMQNELGSNLPGESSQIKQLNLRMANIVGNLAAPNKISNKSGELGPFSKQELEVYKNYCRNTSVTKAEIATSVCRDISLESKKIANQLENSEWKEFKKKHYVEYSRTNPKGYDVYEKKSNFEIVGAGLAQGIASFVPMYFDNLQFNNQLTYMTNQALYMKQYNYMNNPTSPWMMNNNYFQGYYYGSTGMYGMPATNGFNFAM